MSAMLMALKRWPVAILAVPNPVLLSLSMNRLQEQAIALMRL